MLLAMHSRHTFTACSRDLSCCISSPPGQLIGLLSVLLRNHAAMLQAFTTYSKTATLVKYYCPKLTTTANGAQLGGWVQPARGHERGALQLDLGEKVLLSLDCIAR